MQFRGNFIYLLISLLGFLAFMAIFTQYPQLGGWRLLSIAFEISLIIAIWSLIRDRAWFIAGVVLAGIGAVIIVLQFFIDHVWLVYLNLSTVFGFYLMSTVIAFVEMARPAAIDANKIIGSICVYLLMGLNWAFLYYFSELLQPGSFQGLTITHMEHKLFELTYYSYVTLSTLGYGDITPVQPIVQTLAIIEALFGQFYIAILVAILVGTHISSSRRYQTKE